MNPTFLSARLCVGALCSLLALRPLSAQRAEALGPAINTPFEEREPTFSPDGRTLYFWRRDYSGNQGGVFDAGDIWIAQRDFRGDWQEARNPGSALNRPGHEFVVQVSPTGDTLWLCQTPPGVTEAGFGYRVRSRGGWSDFQAAHIRDFRFAGSYKDFHIGPGRVLFFVNEMPEGQGGADLYLAFPLNDTAWGRPLNLGTPLNSPGDEDAPFLSPDGMTLYFNSNGHGGLGNHDMFMSRRLDASWRRWSEPENLGAPLNTPGYDFDFSFDPEGRAYWCSMRGGSNDIFSLDTEACGVDIYPQGDLVLCSGPQGGIASLTLEGGFSPGAPRYQWLRDGRPIPGAQARKLEVSEAGIYQLVRERGACRDTSPGSRVQVQTPPQADIIPPRSMSCLDDSLLLRSIPREGLRYRWQLNGLPIPGATRSSYWVKAPGYYSLEVSDGTCSSRSAPLNLRRFPPPPIYAAADTLQGLVAGLPQFLWANKTPRLRTATYLQAAAADPEGHAFVLQTSERGGKYYDQVHGFFKEGLYRFPLPEQGRERLTERHLECDPEGNVLLAGEEFYLAKYSPDGRRLWSLNPPAALEDVSGLASDLLGNIYTAGRFRDTLRLGGERWVAPARGGMFLAKHSPRGELLWLKVFAIDGERGDFGNALHTDCLGNVYLAGAYELIANFRKTVLRAAIQQENYFLACLAPDGELRWARSVETPRSRSRSQDVHVDCEGNAFLALNRFLFRLDAAGTVRWRGPLLQPAGSLVLRHRIASLEQDLYISALTDRGEYVIVKLNRLDRQIVLWQGRGAPAGPGDIPVAAAGQDGHVYFAGVRGGTDFPGAQLDLTSGSETFLLKYGAPSLQLRREPMRLCDPPLRLMTRELQGLSYQWFRDQQPLPGETRPYLDAEEPGEYQVQAYTESCSRLSEAQSVLDCEGKAPRFERPAPPPAETAPQGPSPLQTDASGAPTRLLRRKVKTQEEISVSGTAVKLYFWDHAAQDGDTVSINLNGEWLLQEYGLRNEKIELSQQLRRGDNYVMLFAHNLGSIKPNTAAILVDDGKRQQSLLLRSNLRQCGMLKIRVL